MWASRPAKRDAIKLAQTVASERIRRSATTSRIPQGTVGTRESPHLPGQSYVEVVHVDRFGTLFEWTAEVTDEDPEPITHQGHRAFNVQTRFERELTLAVLHSVASLFASLS